MSRRLSHLATVLVIVLSTLLVTASLIASPLAGSPAQKTDPPPLASDDKSEPWEELPPDIQAKVDPRILQELNGEITPAHLGGRPEQVAVAAPARKPLDKTRFIVYLKQQADLKAVTARAFASIAAQRAAVADALIAIAQTTQGPVEALLDTRLTSGDVAAYQSFYIFNGFAVEGDLDTLIELARREEVERIIANYPLIPFDRPGVSAAPAPAQDLGGLGPENWNIDLVDAEQVWSALNITGTGAVVAIFDTGVDWTHPALQAKYRGYNPAGSNHNYNWFYPDPLLRPSGDFGPSLTNVPSAVCDPHGTHVAGTTVGDGGTSTTKVGMAPGAKWIAVPGICGGTMPGNYGDDIGGNKAFQWLLCPTDLTGNLATRDCSKAPDVINNSWGSSSPADETFRPAIQALRAAGIAVVFAAGNPSAGPGSIGSPGSVREAITVGATDINDDVASFSGRGPSFYEGEQKPELSAPGVNVKSSVPGGYANYSGTSMAAPHVAGLIGLMLSADLRDGDRDFNVDELERFMEHTAVDLGAAGPDDDYGYGRIDAYNAVRWVLSAGDLRGTVTDANSSAAIDDAMVTGVKTNAGETFTTHTDANGAYSVTVPGGAYDVTVSAFGYVAGAFSGVSVITGANSVVNFSLTPLPTAVLTGSVLSGTTPINGARVAVDARPSAAFTTGANGVYTLTLPVGAHAMIVEAAGYRIKRQTVTVAVGGSSHNFAMTPAPTILLVEAEGYRGWFFARSPHSFFKWSLDRHNYLYDEFIVTNTITSTTILSPMLSGYDVVIWAQTSSTPNSVSGFVNMLRSYLNGSGRLIISGKDIGTAGGTFFSSDLHASLLSSNAASQGATVSGLDFLNGIQLTLNEAALYSFANTATSLTPDAVAPADGSAYTVMTYDNGAGAAALAISPCNAPYRAVYFSAGYENLGPRAYDRPPEFADTLDLSIAWVTGSKLTNDVRAFVAPGQTISPPGTTVTYTLAVANTGVNTDTYTLALSGNSWTTRILSGTTEVTQTVQLAPCGRQTLAVVASIPGTANPGDTDTFTVTATSQANPAVDNSASATTKAFPVWQIETPMPTPRYRLAGVNLPGDFHYYAIGGQSLDLGVAVDVNERYNTCTRQWEIMAPLPQALGNLNAAALDGKIYTAGGFDGTNPVPSSYVYSPAADAWSSIADMPEALNGVALAAANGRLYAFGGSGAAAFVDSVYEYAPASDAWSSKTPMPGGARGYAVAATLDGRIYVVGGWPNLTTVEVYDPASNTWSAAAPLTVGRQSPGAAVAPDGYLYVSGGGNGFTGLGSAERYNPADDTWEMIPALNDTRRAGSASGYAAGRIFAVGGVDAVSFTETAANESLRLLSAFCLSTKQAQQIAVQSGERITYTITLLSDPITLTNASVRDPIPAGATFAGLGPATVSPAPTFSGGLNRVEWSGSLPANQPPVTFTFGVVVNNAGWVSGETITNTATFSDGNSLTFDRSAFTMLDFFDLSSSSKGVNRSMALAGDTLTYTIRVENTSPTFSGAVMLADPVPANAAYVSGSLTHTMGSGGYAGGVITWTGQLSNTDTNYAWGDSSGSVPGVLFSWIEISATGTALNLADDGEANVTLPFPFVFYNLPSTDLRVGNNGAVLFNATSGDVPITNQPLDTATTNNIIAPFWDDIDSDTGNVYFQTIGSAPNRRFVVEWFNRPHFSNVGSATFEMILDESSNNITFQYLDVVFGSAAFDSGASATAGIRQSGSRYVQYSHNTAVLTNSLAVQFVPPPIFADITFAVTTTTPLSVNTWISNTATFTDSRNAVYQRSAATLINSVDLSASTKMADRAEAGAGEPVNYTIVLRNAGLYPAFDIDLSDPIPAHMLWNGVTPVCSSGTCGQASGVITWTGTIDPGAAVTVTFGVTRTTPLPDGTPVTNTATIGELSGGALILPAVTRQAVVLSRAPNLAQSYKTVNPAIPQPGQVVTVTVYVYNSGRGDGAAQMSDVMPTGLTYVPGSLSYGAGSGGFASGVITWTGLAPAGSQVPVQFRATVDPAASDGQAITNTAVITDMTWGLVYQRQAALTVRKPADLSVGKTGAGTVNPGATLVYTITYGNAGPFGTDGPVSVVDTLPAGVTYVSSSPGGVYSATAGTVAWNLGTLGAGANGALALTVSVPNGAPPLTVLTNTVAISAIAQDTNPANNTGEVLTVVGGNVNLLTSAKTVNVAGVTPGGTVTFTISLLNTGNVTASVTITDPIPAGASYVLGSSTLNAVAFNVYNDVANRIEWSGSVPPGGGVALSFRAIISAAGGTTITNTVTIDDGAGLVFTRQAATQAIRYTINLPIILKQ